MASKWLLNAFEKRTWSFLAIDLRATNGDKVWVDCDELPMLGAIRSAKEMKDGPVPLSEIKLNQVKSMSSSSLGFLIVVFRMRRTQRSIGRPSQLKNANEMRNRMLVLLSEASEEEVARCPCAYAHVASMVAYFQVTC